MLHLFFPFRFLRFLSFLHASHDIDTTYAEFWGRSFVNNLSTVLGAIALRLQYGLKSLVTVSY